MASALLEKYGNSVQSLALIPSGGGVYEVMKNENLIFSKKAEERFPELDEIIESLEKPV
jgi:selenoprotein W-related protein